MRRSLKITTVLMMLGCLTACATPVGVREVDRGSVRQVLTENAISADVPSITSRQVMLGDPGRNGHRTPSHGGSVNASVRILPLK